MKTITTILCLALVGCGSTTTTDPTECRDILEVQCADPCTIEGVEECFPDVRPFDYDCNSNLNECNYTLERAGFTQEDLDAAYAAGFDEAERVVGGSCTQSIQDAARNAWNSAARDCSDFAGCLFADSGELVDDDALLLCNELVPRTR